MKRTKTTLLFSLVMVTALEFSVFAEGQQELEMTFSQSSEVTLECDGEFSSGR